MLMTIQMGDTLGAPNDTPEPFDLLAPFGKGQARLDFTAKITDQKMFKIGGSQMGIPMPRSVGMECGRFNKGEMGADADMRIFLRNRFQDFSLGRVLERQYGNGIHQALLHAAKNGMGYGRAQPEIVGGND